MLGSLWVRCYAHSPLHTPHPTLTNIRYGLVGQNGAGKSTLLRCMANGSIPGWPQRCKVVLVEQEDVGDARSSLETVVQAEIEIKLLKEREATLQPAAVLGSAAAAKKALLNLSVLDTEEELRLAELASTKMTRVRGKIADKAALVLRDARDAAVALRDGHTDAGSEADMDEVAKQLAEVQGELSVLDADGLEGQCNTSAPQPSHFPIHCIVVVVGFFVGGGG